MRNAVKGKKPWQQITSNISIAGVVDRDYRPDAQIEKFEREGLIVLPFHEIESLLCHPDLIFELMKIRIAETRRQSREEIERSFIKQAKRAEVSIAIKRMNEIAKGEIQWSGVSRDISVVDLEAAKNEIDRKFQCLKTTIDEFDPTRTFEAELEKVRRALKEPNIRDVLRLVEGKRFLERALKLTDVRTVSDLIAEYRHHIKCVENIPFLAELKRKIIEALNRPPQRAAST